MVMHRDLRSWPVSALLRPRTPRGVHNHISLCSEALIGFDKALESTRYTGSQRRLLQSKRNEMRAQCRLSNEQTQAAKAVSIRGRAEKPRRRYNGGIRAYGARVEPL